MKRLLLTVTTALLLTPVAAHAHILGGDRSAETTGTGVIHVTASASADVEPDRATVNAGVQSQAKTAREAMAMNSAQMQSVYDALEDAGVNRRDIATSYLNLNPQYNYEVRRVGGQPELTGYQVSNQVTVTTTDIDRVGDLIDAMLEAGVNTINGVNFMVKDQEAAKNKARREAIAKARDKAEDMAEAAGVELGRLLVLTEGAAPGRFHDEIIVTGARVAAELSAAPPLAPGQREISSTVTLSFAID